MDMDVSPPSSPQRRHPLRRFLADPYVWVLVLTPAYLLLVSSNWIFSEVIAVDPWVYHGYFRNLQEYKTLLFRETYYGSRLSWILPGYLAYKVLPTMAANYVLHLGLWYAAVFALYYALKETVSREAGLIAAILLGSNAYFLESVGSDYVDGPANVYLLACLAFLTAAARRRSNWLLLTAAGAAFGSAVHSNLFAGILLPSAALYFAVLCRSRGRTTVRTGLRSLAWFLAGSAALTALLGCVNWFIDGSFQFYLPSVNFVRVTIGNANPWRRPLAQWIGSAWWLVLPVAVAAASLIALAHRRFRSPASGPAAAGAFLLAFSLLIVCECWGLPVLQYSYYASYLTPTTFLVLGTLLAATFQRLHGNAALLAAVIVLLANSAPLWGHTALAPLSRPGVRPGLMLLCGAVFALGVLLHAGKARWAMLVAVIGLHWSTAYIDYGFAGRHAARDPFVRISKAAEVVDAARNGEPIRFWHRKTDPYSNEFNALNALYLWEYTMISDHFPEIFDSAMYGPGSLVVIPSSEGDLLAEADAALRKRGYTAQLEQRHEVQEGRSGYTLTFIRIALDYEHLQPLTLRPCAGAPCQNLVSAPSAVNLPLEGWMTYRYEGLESRMERRSGGVHLTTVPKRFGPAVRYGPLVARADGRYMFRLRYGISSGWITFGASAVDDSRWLGQAVIPAGLHGDRTAVLSLNVKRGDSFWLMIVNNHPVGDYSSTCVIWELGAYVSPAQDAAPPRPVDQ